MNRVELVGRITRDPELRVSANGTASVRFSVAVNRRVARDANGDVQADFINCVAFGKTAEFMERYIKKGYLVSVEGRIQTGSYENQQGQRVYTTDVIVESLQNLTPRNSSENAAPNDFTSNSQNNSSSQNSTNDDYTPTLDISSDDLPF